MLLKMKKKEEGCLWVMTEFCLLIILWDSYISCLSLIIKSIEIFSKEILNKI